MKESIFNTRLRLSENTDIVFNALSQTSVTLRKNANLPLEPDDNNDQFLQNLKDNCFICDDTKDELALVRDIFLKSANDDSSFHLTINPTLNCNFRCWYCYEQHHSLSRMGSQTFERLKKLINEILSKFQNLYISFFGGEPMMEFDEMVLPLMEYTRELCKEKNRSYTMSFTTNGFLITDKIISQLKEFNMSSSQITLDGGPEFHNKTRVSNKANSFETIVNNIHKMTAAGLPVLIRINLTKENAQSALQIPDYFKDLTDAQKALAQVSVQQVWQDAGNDIFDEGWDIYEKFLKIGIRRMPKDFDFIKSICYADKRHSAVINYDGRIFKCTAIDFDKKKEDAILTDHPLENLYAAFDSRIAKRFANPLCQKCRILPLCNGGCSKHVDQAGDKTDYCLHPSEEDKDNKVRKVIKEQLILKKLGIKS